MPFKKRISRTLRSESLEQRLVLTGFTAYNSFYSSADINALTTNYADASGKDAAGPLRNAETGELTEVLVSASNLGAVFGGQGTSPFPDTDAHEIFDPFVDFASSERRTIELRPGAAYQYTLENLDVGALYSFAATAIRGNGGYTNRWTLVELQGAESFQIDHSEGDGIYREGLAPNQVALWSGDNAKPGQGLVVNWTDIDPGSDGLFNVVASQYRGSVPASIDSGIVADGSKGYGLTAFRLIEQEPEGPPSLVNQTIDVMASSATVGGTLVESGGQLPAITIYYGTANGGTNPAAWQNSVDVAQPAIDFAANLDGLNENTTYFYRSFAENSFGAAWSPSSASFKTLLSSTPAISSQVPLEVGAISALLAGSVDDTGNDAPVVTLFYGDNDGAMNPDAWGNAIDLGVQTGEFSHSLEDLEKLTPYFFTLRATNFKGSAWSTSRSFTTSDIAPLLINEFVADNATTLTTRFRTDPSDAFRGDALTPDWIEIKSTEPGGFDISGYSLTNDLGSLNRWTFPAGAVVPGNGNLIVFASGINILNPQLDERGHLHTSFTLNASAGEELAIVSPAGDIVASLEDLPEQIEDISYGIGAQGEGRYFATPTPGENNATDLPQAPTISVASRTFIFGESIVVELTAASNAHTIHYTLDETFPTANSPIYTEPITIDDTTMLRAVSVGTNGSKSIVVAESYARLSTTVRNASSHLPLLLVETFNDGIPGTGSRFGDAFIAIVEPGEDGVAKLTDDFSLATRAGIHVRGSSSSGFAKKQYRVEFRDELDEDRKLNVLGMPKEADWIFYGPSQFDRNLISNPLMFDLSNQIERYATRTRWVEAYFNGRYHGVYAIVETIERDDDRVDVEELSTGNGGVPVDGGFIWKNDRGVPYVDPENVTTRQRQYIDSEIRKLENAAASSNFKDPDRGYEAFADVDSFIDHNILNLLAMNVDALRLSSFYYKSQDGKLEAGPIWDFDRSLDSTDRRDNNARTWYGTGDSTRFFDDGSRVMSWWSDMFQDPDFVQRYIDRWFDLRDNQFSDENLVATIDKHAAEIGDAGDRDYARWARSRYGDFDGEIDHLKDWLLDRVNWIDSRWVERPNANVSGNSVPAGTAVSLTSSDGDVYYMLDGTDPRGEDGAIRSVARIANQLITIDEQSHLVARVYDPSNRGSTFYVNKGDDWSAPLQLTAVRVAANESNLTVSEIHFNPLPADVLGGEDNEDNDEFEFAELVNIGQSSIQLEGVQFVPADVDGDSQGIAFTFDAQILEPGEAIVVVENVDAFRSRYGEGIRIAQGRDNDGDPVGQYGGKLSNGGERLKLIAADGDAIREFDYADDWYDSTDGDGNSLVNVQPRSSTSEDMSTIAAWEPSPNAGGSPGFAALDSVTLEGDLDANQRVDIADLDQLYAAIARNDVDDKFDLNEDGSLDKKDVDYMVREVFRTRPGDANLDGKINFQDFLALSASLGLADAGWSGGDFDANGESDFTDFLLLSANFGFDGDE